MIQDNVMNGNELNPPSSVRVCVRARVRALSHSALSSRFNRTETNEANIAP